LNRNSIDTDDALRLFITINYLLDFLQITSFKMIAYSISFET
jgi:hypothetical protein